jgi:two-component system cell cycle response regulator DivK
MPRILLIEDNEMNRDMLSRRLTRKGFEVSIATDGLEGLAAAIEVLPDLILMDLSLPGIDGWEATRRLKGDPATRTIPIIALTAHAMAGDRERAFEAGCDDYDMKPIDFPRLLAKIEAIMSKPEPQIQPEPPTIKPSDLTDRGLLRHDLIGPLVRIIGYCELLAEDAQSLRRTHRAMALHAIRTLAHEIRRSIDGVLLHPPEPDQPIDLELLVAKVLKPAYTLIQAAEALKDASSHVSDREIFLEDLDRIHKDAALLIRMVWQAGPAQANIVETN